MKFEYRLPIRRIRTLPAFPIEQPTTPSGRPPRIARLIALAHKLEQILQSGAATDYKDLARRVQVAPARISQIVILAYLAPEIQEYILSLSAEYSGLITELQLRIIARELLWDRQRSLFAELVSRRR